MGFFDQTIFEIPEIPCIFAITRQSLLNFSTMFQMKLMLLAVLLGVTSAMHSASGGASKRGSFSPKAGTQNLPPGGFRTIDQVLDDESYQKMVRRGDKSFLRLQTAKHISARESGTKIQWSWSTKKGKWVA